MASLSPSAIEEWGAQSSRGGARERPIGCLTPASMGSDTTEI